MSSLRPFEISLLIAIVLLGLETITGTFVFLSFSAGTAVAAAVQAITGGARLDRDVLVFCAVTLLTLAILRIAFQHKKDMRRHGKDINDY